MVDNDVWPLEVVLRLPNDDVELTDENDVLLGDEISGVVLEESSGILQTSKMIAAASRYTCVSVE